MVGEKDLPYKARVCKNCGERRIAMDVQGKEICPICKSGDFEDRIIDFNTKLHCTYCRKEATVKEILGQWITIPFLNIFSMSYYDGCRGWD